MRPEVLLITPNTAKTLLPLTCVEVEYRVGEILLLDKISFTLQPGGPSVVLGANGAGKTLLLRVCHGLLRPTAGRLQWGGNFQELKRRQAMVFQRPVLLQRSVAENIDYVLAIHQVPSAQRVKRLRAVLELTGLSGLAGRAARVLSGGEQQRLALARAWVLAPEVLFLDEPTANLDPAATRAVEQLIIDIAATGTKIVLSTHDLPQAQRLAAEILFLHRGRLLEHTPAATFFACPQSPAANAFVRGELWW